MSWCPSCGADSFVRTVHDTDPYRGEYEQATCSYCGYQDEAEWLPEEGEYPDNEGYGTGEQE